MRKSRRKEEGMDERRERKGDEDALVGLSLETQCQGRSHTEHKEFNNLFLKI